MEVLGIDIGGSGIKGAPVDAAAGIQLADRRRIVTPQPSTPEAVADGVMTVVDHFEWAGPIGVTFPAVVEHGVVWSAANIDDSWIGENADEIFSEATGLDVTVLNDADAAGIAEARFGVGRGRDGLIVMLTFGTGIGSALLMNGVLVPNSELGHIEFRGDEAEHWTAGKNFDEEELSYEEWGDRVNDFLNYIDGLFWPELIIVGGGISKKFDRFSDRLDVRADVLPALMRNNAGIVGAAMAAAERITNP